MSERPTPETDSQIKTFTSVSKLKKSFENRTGTVSAGFARRLERERDEALEALENHTASTTHSCHDQCQRPMCVLRRELDKERERAKELAELVDGSYIFVELHKPDCEYNKKWRVAWMEKAKRLIPGVDSIWY